MTILHMGNQFVFSIIILVLAALNNTTILPPLRQMNIGMTVQISETRENETTPGASRCAHVAERLSRTTRRNGGCIADPRHQSRMRE